MKLFEDKEQRDKLKSARKNLADVYLYVYENWESNESMNNVLTVEYVTSELKKNVESIDRLLEEEE